MKVFVTGISGFVGNAIAQGVVDNGMSVSGQVFRRDNLQFPVTSLEITPTTNWSDCLKDIDCVIHCAAKIRSKKDTNHSSIEQYRFVNTEGTLNLARQAARIGVKRFIFVSSIKVNGEFTEKGNAFVEDEFGPSGDPYGLSKQEAENQLKDLAIDTGMECVIVRPPLIYGPGVKSNFESMLNCVHKKIPLPLGRVNNQRSMIFIDNLVDFILTTIVHPKAVNQTFLVSDDYDVSVSELLREIARCMQVHSVLVPIPAMWILGCLRLFGKQAVATKLIGSLQVDISKAKNVLGWSPRVNFSEGIKKTVDYYLSDKKRVNKNASYD